MRRCLFAFFVISVASFNTAHAVVGGDSVLGGNPATCVIYGRDDLTQPLVPFCSGTLISATQVESAAHCAGLPPQNYKIYCGFQRFDASVKPQTSADGLLDYYISGVYFLEAHDVTTSHAAIGYSDADDSDAHDTSVFTMDSASTITPLSPLSFGEFLKFDARDYKTCVISGYGVHGRQGGLLYTAPVPPSAIQPQADGSVPLSSGPLPLAQVDSDMQKIMFSNPNEQEMRAFLIRLSTKYGERFRPATVMEGDSGSGLLCQESDGTWRLVAAAGMVFADLDGDSPLQAKLSMKAIFNSPFTPVTSAPAK